MLVLSRKACEKIVMTVGEETITVFVTEVRGDKARIGIDAPKYVKILRGEVKEREDKEVSRA